MAHCDSPVIADPSSTAASNTAAHRAIAPAQLRALADRPLFAPIADTLMGLGAQACVDMCALEAWAARCFPRPCTASGKLVHFVSPVASARGYEVRVHEAGEVETRPGNWHDLFNALVWMAFPRTKGVLNALHVDEIESRPPATGRGPARDAATQFDESGIVVLSSDPELFDLLRRRRWVDLFWNRRAEVLRAMRFLVFGHGLYDALRSPFRGLCGRAALIEVDAAVLIAPVANQIRIADEILSRRFSARSWYPRAKAFEPIPVLGIPGVTTDSECRAYYQDKQQFRPLR